MGTISHPASPWQWCWLQVLLQPHHCLPARLHVTLQLTELEPLTACQGSEVMIWSCVLQMVERGTSIDKCLCTEFTRPFRKTHTHIHVAVRGFPSNIKPNGTPHTFSVYFINKKSALAKCLYLLLKAYCRRHGLGSTPLLTILCWVSCGNNVILGHGDDSVERDRIGLSLVFDVKPMCDRIVLLSSTRHSTTPISCP